MPNYQYRCKKCKREWEAVRRMRDRKKERCSNCNVAPEIVPSCNVFVFKAFWHPHMEHEPIYIRSRRHYNEELKKRDLREVG